MTEPTRPRIPNRIRAALRWSDLCSEEVSRKGELQPCETGAVALRIDPREDSPYPVCAYHARSPMVLLADLVAAINPATEEQQA